MKAPRATTDRIRVRYEFTVVLRRKVPGLTKAVADDLSQVSRVINHGFEASGVSFLDVERCGYTLKAEFPKPPRKRSKRKPASEGEK